MDDNATGIFRKRSAPLAQVIDAAGGPEKSPKRRHAFDHLPLTGRTALATVAIAQFDPVGGSIKRVMDLAIAVLALALLSPVMIVLAAVIVLSGGGTPIFSHRRVGFNGRMFPCYKFRTMARDAPEALARYLAENPAAAREWREKQKLCHDPRVTRLGRVLRKCSLDELPQLLNVLRGDMSCIGPRPVTVEELDRYGDKVGCYLSARPGLTGLWQVSGRSATDFAIRVAADERYVCEWSLIGDIVILAHTPAAVLRISEAE